jgi:hypothetical protein
MFCQVDLRRLHAPCRRRCLLVGRLGRSRFGKPAVEPLAQEAIRDGRTAKHRIAILDVIQQIGGPFGPGELFSLQSLLQHGDPGVRAKAEAIIMSMGSSGLPDSPIRAVFMRAFNPLLAVPPPCPPRRTRLSDFNAVLRGDPAAIKRRVRSSAARQKRDEREQERGSGY